MSLGKTETFSKCCSDAGRHHPQLDTFNQCCGRPRDSSQALNQYWLNVSTGGRVWDTAAKPKDWIYLLKTDTFHYPGSL